VIAVLAKGEEEAEVLTTVELEMGVMSKKRVAKKNHEEEVDKLLLLYRSHFT
jgi:hypothetical protein